MQDIWEYFGVLAALAEFQFLFIFISFVCIVNHQFPRHWSLIWKALCPYTKTSMINHTVSPGLTLRAEQWCIRVHDCYVDHTPHLAGWRLWEARAMSENDIHPLSLLKKTTTTIYLKCVTRSNIHTHSEMITIVKLINTSSLIVTIFWCVWWKALKSTFLANLHSSVLYY